MRSKIVPIDELSNILARLKEEGKTIVQCHGVFDLLHPGHIHHLRSAKEQGDILVVTLTKDAYINKGPGRPAFNEGLRSETIAALEVVDYVSLVDDHSAVGSIYKLKPHVYVKGEEYLNPADDVTGNIVEETKAVRKVGGDIFFTRDEVVFSSSSLINRFMDFMSPEQRAYMDTLRARYGSERSIIESVRNLKNLKVLLIGDAIIDEYVYCEPLGLSWKQQVVVHQYLKEERFCGGVAAVANQIADFCSDVHLVTVLGSHNSFEEYIRSRLKNNVNARIFLREDAPTVVKRRYLYLDVEKKVFEICHIRDHDAPEPIEKEIVQYLAEAAPQYDLVMISDYGHGTVSYELAVEARRSARFLAVNAQSNGANIGYNLITKKYSGLDFACVDEWEARLALEDKHGPVEEIGLQLLRKLGAKRLIITRGKIGSMIFDHASPPCVCPAFAMQVVDRVGAGDAFFAVAAPCAAVGMPLDLVSFIGNAVGALACQVVGNRETVAAKDLFKFITTLLK